MRIRVERKSGVAVYRQIAEQMRLEFVSGRVRAGERLPGLRELAEHAGVAVAVVKRAYGELEKAGWIETRDRSGSFVTVAGTKMGARERVKRVAERVEELLREAKALGFRGSEVVKIVKEVEGIGKREEKGRRIEEEHGGL